MTVPIASSAYSGHVRLPSDVQHSSVVESPELSLAIPVNPNPPEQHPNGSNEPLTPAPRMNFATDIAPAAAPRRPSALQLLQRCPAAVAGAAGTTVFATITGGLTTVGYFVGASSGDPQVARQNAVLWGALGTLPASACAVSVGEMVYSSLRV